MVPCFISRRVNMSRSTSFRATFGPDVLSIEAGNGTLTSVYAPALNGKRQPRKLEIEFEGEEALAEFGLLIADGELVRALGEASAFWIESNFRHVMESAEIMKNNIRDLKKDGVDPSFYERELQEFMADVSLKITIVK